MVVFTMSSLWDCPTHSVVSSGAVTVTPINVQQIPTDEQRTPSFSRNIRGVKESLILKADSTNDAFDADGEVSKIDFTGVAMRIKNERGMQDENNKNDVERPMSWEGELSDNEFKQEDMDEGVKESADMDSSDSIKEEYNDGKPKPLNFTNQVMMDQITDNVKANKMSNSEIPLLVDKLLGGSFSPVLANKTRTHIPPIPSPDSAIHSCYSPTQSPITSRHLSSSGFSSPSTFTPSLSRNNSDASQYGGSQHSSCYSHSYSSVSASPTQFSPTDSPVQIRHGYRTHSEYTTSGAGNNVYGINRLPSSSNSIEENNCHLEGSPVEQLPEDNNSNGVYEERSLNGDINHHSIGLNTAASSGISRQQLINSPCPICGDKISGFHYGIFSCESCKGFFKRTVQNHKNYVCLRGSGCVVTITTRKKCPACRFDKCLNMGMKLEAIRVDRTRGGRSTYPFSYTLPSNVTHSQSSTDLASSSTKQETSSDCTSSSSSSSNSNRLVPRLLQEIMDVEHLWQYNERDAPTSAATDTNNKSNTPMDSVSNLCNIADHRLYKIVKWCKSLPLFKNISIDDQISLLINAWCELLLFSCCYRSMTTPGEIKVSLGKSISLHQAKELGLAPCIDRMLNFTEHLRRLRVDRYEYVAMKVIVLLSSDSSDLRQPEKARASQEKALQALQEYTVAHYPDIPSKFGELLLRIPDLQRTCQVGKEMLSIKHKEGEGPSFDLLMELLRGDH